MTVQAVSHILSVEDIERGSAFYCDVLGFRVLDKPGAWWRNLTCGNGDVSLNAYQGTRQRKKTALSLLVDDLDAACKAVVAGGGEVLNTHEPHPGSNVRLAEIVDTEGNEVLLAMRVAHKPGKGDVN